MMMMMMMMMIWYDMIWYDMIWWLWYYFLPELQKPQFPQPAPASIWQPMHSPHLNFIVITVLEYSSSWYHSFWELVILSPSSSLTHDNFSLRIIATSILISPSWSSSRKSKYLSKAAFATFHKFWCSNAGIFINIQ